MPLLVAAWQNKITARYNIVEEGTAGVEQSLENSAFSVHCSLLTTHYSLRSRCRLAKQNHCALQYCRPTADFEGIGELNSVSHRSLLTAPRVAIEPRGVICNCSLLPASSFFPALYP
jgi:hypothetical protein